MGRHHLYRALSFNNKKHDDDMGFHLPPKGRIAIRVGEEEERFVVPVAYLNHPLFVRLLKEAEEEYGFEQKGAIAIPCHVDYFRQVQGIIDRDIGLSTRCGHGGSCGGGGEYSQHHHHLHLPLSGCFKARDIFI